MSKPLEGSDLSAIRKLLTEARKERVRASALIGASVVLFLGNLALLLWVGWARVAGCK